MTAIQKSPPPAPDNGGPQGMTLRDYFAAAALIGMLSKDYGGSNKIEDYASDAYETADAMLSERKRGGGA